MKLFVIFIVLNILNVILQTVKAICTIKCGKLSAALINAIAFGLYTVVLVYMNCDLSTGVKALVVAVCNLIGVYVVKSIEEKVRKDKIWKIEFSTPVENINRVVHCCQDLKLSYNYLNTNTDYVTFNFYCNTQKETEYAHIIIKAVGGKYFITETKSF